MKVSLIDSMVWRRGLNRRVPARSGSPLRATALDRAGVDHPHVIGPQGGIGGQCPDDAQDEAGTGPQPLAVTGLLGQVGEQVSRLGAGVCQGTCRQACRSQWAAEVNPHRACTTARVTSSASESLGVMPTGGRAGAQSGEAFSKSSIFGLAVVPVPLLRRSVC